MEERHHPQPVIIYELLRDMEYWITASFVFSVVLAVDHSWALRFKVFSKCGFFLFSIHQNREKDVIMAMTMQMNVVFLKSKAYRLFVKTSECLLWVTSASPISGPLLLTWIKTSAHGQSRPG